MIVKVSYANFVPAASLKVSDGTKQDVTGYQNVVVTQGTILEAIQKCSDCPSVVSLQLDPTTPEADLSFLKQHIVSRPNKPILYKVDLTARNIDEIQPELLKYYSDMCSEYVRLIFKCPKGYCDLKTVLELSRQYPNIRFCGGYFLNHPDGHFGCLCSGDVKGHASRFKKPIIQGCCSVLESIDYESAEITYIENAVTKKASKSTNAAAKKSIAPKAPKKTTTLFSLSKDGLGAF